MIRVFVVHDDPIALDHLRRVLDGAGDVAVAGQATHADQPFAAPRAEMVDVVVMGLIVPRDLETQESIDYRHVGVPLVVFAPIRGCAEGGQPRRGRAVGYLCSGAAPANLVAAVRAVRTGKSYVCPYLGDVENPAPIQGHTANPLLKRLTPRELELFRQLASGKPNREIARVLGLSPKTVSAHRMHILAKLGLHSNIELAHMAFSEGLVDTRRS